MVLQKRSFRIPIAILLIIVLVVALTLCLLNLYSPFHYRRPESIKSWIKEELPVGTDKETVRAWLAEYPELDVEERDGGYYSFCDHTLTKEEQDASTIVGVTRIWASTSYLFIFETRVDVYFGFDENDCLVDVGVGSETDSF